MKQRPCCPGRRRPLCLDGQQRWPRKRQRCKVQEANVSPEQLLYETVPGHIPAAGRALSGTIPGFHFGHLCGYFLHRGNRERVQSDEEHLCSVAKPKQSIQETRRVDIRDGGEWGENSAFQGQFPLNLVDGQELVILWGVSVKPSEYLAEE